MSKHEWTAEEVYGLVKDWPDDAKADARYRPSNGKFVNVAKWVHGDGRISSNAAALLFTASGIEWLCEHSSAHVMIRTYATTSEVVGYQHDDVPEWIGSGPTLLHAITSAIKHTQGKE